MLHGYLPAFAVTLLVEVPVYLAALTLAAGVRWRRAVLMAIGVNVVTHPLLWWTLRPLTASPAYPYLFLGAELTACLVEWALLVAWTRRPGRTPGDLAVLAAASVTANAASVLAGLLLARS